MMQLTTRLVDPMAADADFPRKLPTKIRSTVLYNCWIKLLPSKGRANLNKPFAIGPSVRLLDLWHISDSLFLDSIQDLFAMGFQKWVCLI